MAYVIPKTDYTSNQGMTFEEVNRLGHNMTYLKGKTDEYDIHAADTTKHKTSDAIRQETGAICMEVRSDDPTTPAVGRFWLNTSK